MRDPSMKNLSPEDTYQVLAVNLRSRLDFAENTLANPYKFAFQTVETVSLQGRKSVETIAYMMLVATEHAFGRANMPRDIRGQWNAEPIFKELKKRKLDLIPSPQRVTAPKDSPYSLVIEGIAEHRLSYDDLVRIYRVFHKGLHEPNPYAHSVDDAYYLNLLPEIHKAISQIKNLTWRHLVFINGHAFLCILSDDNGNVHVRGLDNLPEDVR